jgi:hypothetical protein
LRRSQEAGASRRTEGGCGAAWRDARKSRALQRRWGAGMVTYRISIERRAHYLYVSVAGESSTETIRRYVREIREACVQSGVFKVLAVVNLEGPGVSMLDLYKVVADGSDASAGIGMRAAYVELNPLRSDANMQMAENVALTRGIPVRTFRDVAAAEAWLLTGPGA